MNEVIEHGLTLAMLCGGMGYLLLMAIITVGMLRAARRTSDDWTEHIARGTRLEA